MFPFLETFVGFLFVVTVFHIYLDVRQLKAISRPKPPPVLAAVFSQELYQKTQAYSLDKWYFGFVHSIYQLFETITILLAGGLPWLWFKTGEILDTVPIYYKGEIVHTIVFVLVLSFFNLILSIPWSLYSTFVVEQRHGFNKQTLSLFFSDVTKQIGLALMFMPPIIGGLTFILMQAGPFVALYLWAFVLTLSLVMMTIYPIWIAPLFNKYEPLPEGSLRTNIEALANSVSFPLKKLYTVDGSKRSGHSNAYMYGFFKNKRIVLYDTLINQCSEEQVVSVLAHELGHWKLRHTPILFVVGQTVMFIEFMIFTVIRATPGLYESFGFGAARPAFIALILFQFISSPVDEVIHYLQNIISRRFEFQADGFAVSLGQGKPLRGALLKLEEENKSAMNVDPWYSAYHYSHPPLVERLKAIDAAVKKEQ